MIWERIPPPSAVPNGLQRNLENAVVASRFSSRVPEPSPGRGGGDQIDELRAPTFPGEMSPPLLSFGNHESGISVPPLRCIMKRHFTKESRL